jgi:hypothetical protein
MATTLTDKPAVQALIKLEKDEEDRRRSISNMPTEAEVDEIEDRLQAAFDVLEMVAYTVETIATSSDGADLQFQIGIDDLGVLYVLSANVHSRLDELQKNLECVDRAAWSLDCIRREQRSREEPLQEAKG